MSWRSWMAFAALGVIWGLPYFFVKLAVQELSPLVIAWGRVALGTFVLLPIAWKRGALRPLAQHKLALCAFALVEFVIPFSAIALGERWVSSSVTGILIATVPLSVAVLSRFFGVHEHLGAWRVTGLALGFIGVLALLGLGTISGAMGWAGVVCMLIASVGYAVGPLIIQRHLRGLDSFGPLAASLLIASAILVIPALPRLAASMADRGCRRVGERARHPLHGPGDAAHVLSRHACGPVAGFFDHLHQSRSRGAAGRGIAA